MTWECTHLSSHLARGVSATIKESGECWKAVRTILEEDSGYHEIKEGKKVLLKTETIPDWWKTMKRDMKEFFKTIYGHVTRTGPPITLVLSKKISFKMYIKNL